MDLDGHYLITKRAIEELKGKISILAQSADLAAVTQDINDILNGGHWTAEGQRHHFMAIKGQTQESAFNDAMAWIKTHATMAAAEYIGGFGVRAGQGVCIAGMTSAPGQTLLALKTGVAAASGPTKGQTTVPIAYPLRSSELVGMRCSGAMPLGTAAHAVEDSFAPMHVQRSGGSITKILVYDGQDHKEHDHEDRAWEEKKDTMSPIGLAAVEAVKDLFLLVDATVQGGNANNLIGWEAFVDKWFKANFRGGDTPLVGPPPATTAPVPNPTPLHSVQPRHHTIRGGQSLSVIAGIYYDDVLLWPAIYDANRTTLGKDPNFVQPGWVINIPEIPDKDRPALQARGMKWRRAS